MGMSTHIVGFIPPDETWKKKKAAYDACREAGVPVPVELSEFFGDEEPDDNGREVDLKPRGRAKVPGVTAWGADSQEGYEVNLAELAEEYPDVKILRFYNAW